MTRTRGEDQLLDKISALIREREALRQRVAELEKRLEDAGR